VRALIGLGRQQAIDAEIAAFEAAYGKPDRVCDGGLMLRYRVARWHGDWKRALELTETIGREQHERDDDGQLGSWETEKFECLARLGEVDRALHFGERQALDADGLASLAWEAVSADVLGLAGELASRALRVDPEQATALHALARVAEVNGNVDQALVLWGRIGEIDDDWHVAHEHVARVLLGTGDARMALNEAEQGVAEGHTCAWAFAARGQARLLTGDREGATTDLQRAWQLAAPETRASEGADVWGIRALLAGDRKEGDRLLTAYLREGAPISAADRARVARCREALAG